MSDIDTTDLRREIGFLGVFLGDTIRQFEGDAMLVKVEQLRRAAWDRRSGRAAADQRMKHLIAQLDDREIRIVIRAFTVFLDLLNLVEDRRRVHVLRERTRNASPEPRAESVGDAIGELKQAGKSAEAMQDLIDHLKLELVFPAHPTEAKRRSIRSKLRQIRQLMRRLDGDPLPSERDRTFQQIRAEIAKLWQTDFIRPWRPSVMQEVGRGLSIKSVLWDEIPKITDELRSALVSAYGHSVRLSNPILKFGSWIGGDRDGHPGVTADVTAETLIWLRREALSFHLGSCESLFESLSLSDRQVHLDHALVEQIERAVEAGLALLSE